MRGAHRPDLRFPDGDAVDLRALLGRCVSLQRLPLQVSGLFLKIGLFALLICKSSLHIADTGFCQIV